MSVQLIHDTVSRDAVEAARAISELVGSGQAIGLFFGLRFKGGQYIVNVAGRCASDPTYTRGMLGALDDELSRIIQGKADSDTTI